MTQVDEGSESPSANPGLMTAGAAQVGEVLAERYELVKHINEDATGRQVWRGVDVLLRRPVAVVLRYPGGDAAAEMLSAAVATSRVMHPHLIGVYDAADEGDRAYVVREWVDGQALRDVLLSAPLDPRQATSVVYAVSDAVATLHAADIAHGNIHPGTVLIATDGRVVLADARADGSTSVEADVRAVGAILYATLTGHWPHAEAGPSALPDALRDANGRPTSPHQVRGGLPRRLSAIASDLLDPATPVPPADAIATEFRRLDTEATDPVFGGSALDFADLDEPEPPNRKLRTNKVLLGVAGLLVIALVGLLVGTRLLSGGSASGTAGTAASPSASTPGPHGSKTVALPIGPAQVRIVDPMGDGTELGGADKTVDGSLATAWKTDHYTTATFGNKKPGMGVLINLDGPHEVKSVTVAMSEPGATVTLMAGTTDPGPGKAGGLKILSTYQQIGTPSDADSGPTLSFPVGQQVRYLLVWITKMPEVAPGTEWPYQAGIQEITVLTTSP